MKQYVPLVLDTIAVVALAVWLGGLAACWIPLAASAHAVPSAAMPVAQAIFAETLWRFSALTESCGVILVAQQWVLRRRYQYNPRLFVVDGARMVAVFVALFAAEYGRYVLIPALMKTQSLAAINSLAGFAVVQAILLIVYAAVTAWLQSPVFAVKPARPVQSPANTPVVPQVTQNKAARRQKR